MFIMNNEKSSGGTFQDNKFDSTVWISQWISRIASVEHPWTNDAGWVNSIVVKFYLQGYAYFSFVCCCCCFFLRINVHDYFDVNLLVMADLSLIQYNRCDPNIDRQPKRYFALDTFSYSKLRQRTRDNFSAYEAYGPQNCYPHQVEAWLYIELISINSFLTQAKQYF